MTDYEDLDAQLRAWLDEDEALARATTPVPLAGQWRATRDKHAPEDAKLRLVQGRDPYEGEEWNQYEAGEYNGTPIIVFSAEWHDEAEANLRFIASHDPAAVLADIAGKRALLDHVASWPHTYAGADAWYSCSLAELPSSDVPGSGCADEKRAGKPCDCGLDKRRLAVLRCAAAGYVDRSEFKAEWRLDG